ncbi:MAG: hypothetical protein U0736_03290 [Gemmataceae bacterium]
MSQNTSTPTRTDELLAELASAAYRAAQRQGFQGAFIDAELDMWHALRAVLGSPAAVPAAPLAAAG